MTAAASLRVLVVEDHADTLKYLRSYLEALGHSVSSAPDVGRARESLVDEEPFDVLLCDLGLPDGTGWDLLAKLTRPIFAVAMSGNNSAADMARSRDAGFRDHLAKPFPLNRLRGLLDRASEEKTTHG